MVKVVACVLFLNLPLFAQTQTKTDREASNLKGPVKTVEARSGGFLYRFNQYQENCCKPRYKLSFDLNGKLIEVKSERPAIDYGPVDPPRIDQKYDDKGRLAETISYKPDGSVSNKKVFSYDSRGNNIEISYYSGKGELYNKKVLKYDEKDNLVEYTTYFKDGSPMYKETYSNFDAHGNWLKRIHWDWDTEDSKGAWEPLGVTYRTLTYY